MNSTDMAKMLGITKQSFYDGVKSGRFTSAQKGKYGHPLFDPAVVKRQYATTRDAAQLQDHARDLPSEMRGGRPSSIRKQKDNKGKVIDAQQILLVKMAKEANQAKLMELKYRVTSGLYIEKAEAKKQGVELAEMVMGVLQSWPSRLAPELASMRDGDEHDYLQRLEQEVNILIIAIRTQCGRAERNDYGK